MKTTIVCDDWRALRRNTLLGFAAIKIQELHLLIRDVAIHEKEGRRWAQLPAKPQIKEGALVTDGAGRQNSVLRNHGFHRTVGARRIQ
jgi:hypothetical protein